MGRSIGRASDSRSIRLRFESRQAHKKKLWIFASRLTWVRLQQSQEQRYSVLQSAWLMGVCSCFRNTIHRTLTYMDYRIFNVRTWSFLRLYTRGLGTPTANQHNIFDWKILTIFVCAADGVRTSGLWISSPTLYQWSHHVTLSKVNTLLIPYFYLYFYLYQYLYTLWRQWV